VQGLWFEAKWASGSPVQIRLTGVFLLAVMVALALWLLSGK